MSLPTQSDVSSPVSHAADKHVVEFYDTEEFLVGTVAGFAGPALNAGDAMIVVATALHRAAFEAALRASRVDVDAALASGRYLPFDAAERLNTFMVAGAPDRDRFTNMVGPLIQRAGAGGRQVRIYGEMVAVLWEAGHVVSAIALEDLWNGLAKTTAFLLLCAYPMRSFGDAAHAADFDRICDRHSAVIPTENHATLGGDDAQRRVVARLQQSMAVLEADIVSLRANRDGAGRSHVERPFASTSAYAGPRALPAPTISTRPSHLDDSPGGRLLIEPLGTLANRIRYAEPA